MRHTLINHPRLKVVEYVGSEGPSHDPYGYKETHIHTPDKEIVLHAGLAVYIKLDGKRIEPSREEYDNPDVWFGQVVMENTGYRFNDFKRWSRKAKRQCPSGGRHDTISMNGYPGETFDFCAKCGNAVESFFNEGAVI